MSDGIVADEWQTAVPNSSINRSSGRGCSEATGQTYLDASSATILTLSLVF